MSTSQVAGITGMCHHIQFGLLNIFSHCKELLLRKKESFQNIILTDNLPDQPRVQTKIHIKINGVLYAY
jgi:hypothetical protein